MMDQPRHIGIILDGNRRYAKRKGKKPWEGHRDGRKTAEKLLEWAKDRDIEELTLYAFSMQNFKRPKEEVEELFNLLRDGCKMFLDKKFEDKHKIRIRFIGRTQLFPQDLQDQMAVVEEKTKENGPHKLNMCVAYGGREEVTDAVKSIAQDIQSGSLQVDEVTQELITSRLWLQSEPEMIIRTSGEHRTSNFLIWQGNYAEWFFVDKMWPEFSKEDFYGCIDEYCSRQRRFGQ